MTKKIARMMSAFIIMALLAGVAPVANSTPVAKAAVSDNGIVYDGEGTITKTLTTGVNVSVTLTDCIPTIVLGGESSDYPFTTRHIGAAVIADDDLIHMFWLTGHYVVIDARTGKWLYAGYTAYDEDAMKVAYIKADSTKDTACVKGMTGAAIHTCIINNKYFYNNSSMMMRLMTRAEFEALRYETATPAPATPAPTEEPVVVPTLAPTQEPVVLPTLEPLPTIQPATLPPVEIPTMPPQPSVKPTVPPLPTFAPLPTGSAAPDTVIETEVNWSSMTETEIYAYWQKHFAATITWEEFAKSIWGEKWQESTISQTTNTEHTHNEYDANGNLIDSVTTSTSTTVSNTVGDKTGTEVKQEVGAAKVEAVEEGAAVVKATSVTQGHANARTTIKGKTGSGSGSSKAKVSTHVKRPAGAKGRIRLVKTVNGKSSTKNSFYLNKKKRIATYGLLTTKGVVRGGFIESSEKISYMIYTGKFVKVNGKKKALYKIQIVPTKGAAKGKRKAKTLKGLYIGIESSHNCGLDRFAVKANGVKVGLSNK